MEFQDSTICTPTIPIFRPSEEEFADFASYIQKIEKFGYVSGLCKIIPPTSWRERMPPFSKALSGSTEDPKVQDAELLLKKVVISKPIQQQFSGSNGCYAQLNMESNKKFDVFEFKRFAESFDRKTRMKEDDSDDRYARLESSYWKSLLFSDTYYGADLSGSLFPESIRQWNISRLPNLLEKLKSKVAGVNTPYLYFGMWKATFAWHVEDMDLFSINYIHFGEPKQWYCVPPSHRKQFETLAKSCFASGFQRCPQYLRHKSCVISPSFLEKNNIPVSKMIQKEGEIMITFPYGYHQGFNYGFNCAESTNFAFDSWIEIGKVSQRCKCASDTVLININDLAPSAGILKLPLVK